MKESHRFKPFYNVNACNMQVQVEDYAIFDSLSYDWGKEDTGA